MAREQAVYLGGVGHAALQDIQAQRGLAAERAKSVVRVRQLDERLLQTLAFLGS